MLEQQVSVVLVLLGELEEAEESADGEEVLVSFLRHSQFLADELQPRRELFLSSPFPLPAETFGVVPVGQLAPRAVHMPSGPLLELEHALLERQRGHLDVHARYCDIRSFLSRGNSFPLMMPGHHCAGVGRPYSSAGIWEDNLQRLEQRRWC